MDIEGDDQNDNLSDMISANVSGRGTPNVSGKQTNMPNLWSFRLFY